MKRSYVFGFLEVFIHGAKKRFLEGEEEEEMEVFIHGFLKEEDDGSWHPFGEEEMRSS